MTLIVAIVIFYGLFGKERERLADRVSDKGGMKEIEKVREV